MEGEWKRWHGWSRSRQSLLENCPCRYYYQYVKAFDVEYGDILNVTKRMSKKMYNIKFLLGTLVHETIELQLNHLSRGRDVSGTDAAIKYISRVIADINENPKKYLIEAMNDEKISEEEILNIGKEAERQVGIFFNEFFDFYKNLKIITHEKFCEIVLDGHKFWVVPDLITESNDGRVYITDWKTDSSYPLDKWQMKQYILWALEEGISDLEHLRAEVIFLDSGKSEEYETTQEEIDSFKNELVEKYRELFEYVDSRSGKEDFPKCESEEICISCGYKPYCDTN